jgi:hypothetical protein
VGGDTLFVLAEILDIDVSMAVPGRGTRAFYLIVPHRVKLSLVQRILCPINRLDGIGIRTGDFIWGNPQKWAILGMKLPIFVYY